MHRRTNRRAGIPSAIVSAFLVVVLSISLSGCSALFIHQPPKSGEAGPGPECSSNLWPVVDIAWVVAHAAYAVMIIVFNSKEGFCGGGDSGSGEYCIQGYLASMPFLSMAAVHGLSAGVGFGRNSRCREARRAAIETVKIRSGENRYKAPKIRPPEIILKSKEPVAVEKDREQESEDLTVPMKFELPLIEERKAQAESLEDQLLEEEIKTLKLILERTEGPVKADLLFRLAERYLEKSIQLYEFEMKKYDAMLKNWEEDKNRHPDTPKPLANNRGSMVWLKAAFDIYRVILKYYKDYRRRDEVLFLYAYGLMKFGEKQEGVGTYRQLIEEHPESRFVADAYLALGEHLFDAGDYESAKKEYGKSGTYKGTKASYLAKYKLAWCYLKLGNKPEARAIMNIVAFKAKSEKLRSRASRELAAGMLGDGGL